MEVNGLVYSQLPFLSLLISFACGVICLFTCLFRVPELLARKVGKTLLLVGTSLALAVVMSVVPYVVGGEVVETPTLFLKVDSTNMAAIVGVALIFFFVSIYNVGAEKEGRLKPGLYSFFLLLLLSCILGVLLSNDLFSIYFLAKIAVVVSVMLVTHNPSKQSTEAAFKYLVITSIGAIFVLLGILIIFILTGSSNLLSIISNSARLTENPRMLMLAVACFVIGFGADIGLVPFHGWLPDVYSESTMAVVGFLSVKPIALILTLYRLIAPLYQIYPSNTIIVLTMSVGMVSMIFGVLVAYPQRNFYRMLAYCSIDEFGHIVFALSLFTSPLSLIAGQYYLVNGALMKTGAILSLGSVFSYSGTKNMDLLGGLFRRMNKTALSYLICTLSLAGVPPFGGFYSKWLLYNAIYDFLQPLGGIFIAAFALALLVCISMILFILLLRSFHRIFMGQAPENLKGVKEVHITMWLPTVFLSGIAVLLGLQPNILLGLMS